MQQNKQAFEGFERLKFRSGENIFEDGEEGCCAYFIENGQAEVISHHGHKNYRLGILGPGDLFGEMALIDNQPRTATVTALLDTDVISINRDLINSKLAKSDPTIEYLLRLVLQRFRSVHNHFTGNEHLFDETNQQKPDHPFSKTQKNLTSEIRLASDIQEGLKQDQFQLYYQPIVSLQDNRLTGFEALIRWQHPQHGFMSPMQFLNVAEQTDQILPLGIWTLEEACKDYQSMADVYQKTDKQLFISVNLSARQLLKARDTARFSDIVHDAHIDPACIKLEVTETIMIEEPDYAQKILSSLSALGFQLSLDDFGTGYSSLSYLQKFPVDFIKIDRSFISQMLDNNECKQIVKASIDLANDMEMEVIAEGIENEQEIDELGKMHCNYGQGYFYAKPLPLSEAIEFSRLQSNRISSTEQQKGAGVI